MLYFSARGFGVFGCVIKLTPHCQVATIFGGDRAAAPPGTVIGTVPISPDDACPYCCLLEPGPAERLIYRLSTAAVGAGGPHWLPRRAVRCDTLL